MKMKHFVMVLLVPVFFAPASGQACWLDSMHPLEVRVRLVEDLEAEQWLQAEVDIQSRLDLTDLHIELVPTPEVRLSGPNKARLASITSGVPAKHTFVIRVADQKEQQQVHVVVRGKYQGQEIRRGATVNLLAQGPHHPGRLSETPRPNGNPVMEYRGAARRIK